MTVVPVRRMSPIVLEAENLDLVPRGTPEASDAARPMNRELEWKNGSGE
jgi:hypothetical protein